MTPEETGQFVIVKSTADGVPWSQPESITPQVKDANNATQSCFIASTDHGATWRISPAVIPGKPPTSESAIAELRDGSLLLSLRDESRSGQRTWARWE